MSHVIKIGINQAICRTVENVILLITQGDEKNGVNKKALEALQEMFKSDSIGRTVVADWSTKIDFIIPDLKKVLGKEKYEIVDKDIQDGLLSILGGDAEKFANQSTKISIVLERLKEGHDEFERFIQPEIDRICDSFGLKQKPELKFSQSNLQDRAQFQKLVQRFVELGVFTPKDAFIALEESRFPENEDMLENQQEFKKQKDEGLFVPLTFNGANQEEEPHGEGGRPTGTGTPKSQNSTSPIGSGLQSKATITNIISTYKNINKIYSEASKTLKKSYNIKDITKEYEKIIQDVCEDIVIKLPMDKWEETAKACFSNIDNIKALEEIEVPQNIKDISEEYKFNYFCSAVINCSRATK
jgi:hypothetical protein